MLQSAGRGTSQQCNRPGPLSSAQDLRHGCVGRPSGRRERQSGADGMARQEQPICNPGLLIWDTKHLARLRSRTLQCGDTVHRCQLRGIFLNWVWKSLHTQAFLLSLFLPRVTCVKCCALVAQASSMELVASVVWTPRVCLVFGTRNLLERNRWFSIAWLQILFPRAYLFRSASVLAAQAEIPSLGGGPSRTFADTELP